MRARVFAELLVYRRSGYEPTTGLYGHSVWTSAEVVIPATKRRKIARHAPRANFRVGTSQSRVVPRRSGAPCSALLPRRAAHIAARAARVMLGAWLALTLALAARTFAVLLLFALSPFLRVWIMSAARALASLAPRSDPRRRGGDARRPANPSRPALVASPRRSPRLARANPSAASGSPGDPDPARLGLHPRSTLTLDGPSSASAPAPTHLFVLVHGLGGTPEDLSCLERNLLLGARREGFAALVLKPGCNVLARSFDGVRAGAARVADEIRAVVASHPTLVDISLVGNSLGGIYARYAAALLFDEDAGTVAGLRPDAFLTTATPHLGVGPFGYLGLFPSPMRAVVGPMLGATTRELSLADGGRVGAEDEAPLLARMADAGTGSGGNRRDEPPFLAALGSFRRRCAYANAVNDFLVAYETASLDPDAPAALRARRGRERGRSRSDGWGESPWSGPGGWGTTPDFPGWGFGGSPRIADERDHVPGAGASAAPIAIASAANAGGDELRWQRRMAAGLRTLSWHHVDVEFPGMAPLAHNKICALQRDPVTAFLFKEGEFVVEHQAAYLLRKKE